jgi:hypothetical protein
VKYILNTQVAKYNSTCEVDEDCLRNGQCTTKPDGIRRCECTTKEKSFYSANSDYYRQCSKLKIELNLLKYYFLN